MNGSSCPSNPLVPQITGSAPWRGFGSRDGRNIGHRAICRFPLVAARKLTVEITGTDRPAPLGSVELHNSAGLAHQH
jgi:hypothetical protein